MSTTVEISDGTTTISDGDIICNSITTNKLATSNFQATLTDGACSIQNRNITGVNTLSWYSFQTSDFQTPYLSVDTMTSTTVNNQFIIY